MSQAGSINITSTPSVPTTFTGDNGSAVPAANILLITADDITDNNVNGITAVAGAGQTGGDGNPLASNELQVQLTNRFQATGSSINGATEDLITFDLGATNAVYRVEFKIAGRDTATGDGVGYTTFASIKTDGATATIVDSPFKDADEDNSLQSGDLNIIASGNNLVLRATGVAGQTVSYSAVGYYVVV